MIEKIKPHGPIQTDYDAIYQTPPTFIHRASGTAYQKFITNDRNEWRTLALEAIEGSERAVKEIRDRCEMVGQPLLRWIHKGKEMI